ncbi:hypothetical protein RP20_CCG006844 [Aedes albopictus]|nr:hypothetical protein RP20_CCG006844 [Aedes albopictus]
MVELSSSTDPYQHGFPNIVFVLPAIVVVGLCGPINMENVIEDIISESTAGDAADMGQDLPKMPSFGGAGNFKMPSMEEFIKMLENMDNLSDEEKEQLKLDVMKNSMGSRKMEAGLSDYMVFLVMVLLIASVFDPGPTGNRTRYPQHGHAEYPCVYRLGYMGPKNAS